MPGERLSWDDVWARVASQVAHRTLCVRAEVGAVITDQQNRIVATGYNGPPAGFPHGNMPCEHWCDHGANDIRNGFGTPLLPCSAVHAEANALLACDRSVRLGGTIFVNKHPCFECCKLIANSGLARLVINPSKPSEPRHHSNLQFLAECGIESEVVHG